MGSEERLKSRKLIDRIFREGRSFSVFPFRVFYITGPLLQTSVAATDHLIPPMESSEPPEELTSLPQTPPAPILLVPLYRLQAGFGASKRNFKRAVDRNRIKRLIREAYRLQKPPLYERLQAKDRSLALFFIYTGKELPDFKIVSEKIGSALQKLMKETGI